MDLRMHQFLKYLKQQLLKNKLLNRTNKNLIMKKLSLLTIILFAAFSSINAQSIFSSYSFNVEQKDQNTVLQLYKDYFGKKENLVKGITVTLYENHFKGKDVATHEVVFSGTPETMGAAYDSKGSYAWALFQTELSKYCKGVRAAEGKRFSSFGDTSSAMYPIQDLYLVNVKNPELFKSNFDAFWSKNIPANSRITFGSITTLNEEKTTHYVVRSFKDFTTKFKDDLQSIKGYAEMMGLQKEIRTFNSSTTRVLLGKW